MSKERAAELAGHFEKGWGSTTKVFLSFADEALIVAALRAYAPVPEDVREAAVQAAYDATRREDGTPQFADAGFCIGHAAKIADAVLSALQAAGWGPRPKHEVVSLGTITVESDGCAALESISTKIRQRLVDMAHDARGDKSKVSAFFRAEEAVSAIIVLEAHKLAPVIERLNLEEADHEH